MVAISSALSHCPHACMAHRQQGTPLQYVTDTRGQELSPTSGWRKEHACICRGCLDISCELGHESHAARLRFNVCHACLHCLVAYMFNPESGMLACPATSRPIMRRITHDCRAKDMHATGSTGRYLVQLVEEVVALCSHVQLARIIKHPQVNLRPHDNQRSEKLSTCRL